MTRSIDGRFQVKEPLFRFGASAAPGIEAADAGPAIAFKLLIVFLLVLYSSIGQIYPQLEVVRPAMTIAVGAILMMIIELATSRQPFKFMWPQSYLMIAILGVAITSTFSAVYLVTAVNTVSNLTKIVLVYILLENTVTSERRLRTVLTVLVIGGLFPAIGSIRNYAIGKLVEGSRAAWVGNFANPNDTSYALVILVPIAAVLMIAAPRWQRFLLLAIIGVYLVAIYLTFSRGGLLGLFAIAGLVGWRQRSVVVRGLIVATIVVGLILVGLFWERKDSFEDISTDTTFNQRIITVKAGLRMFVANPFLGVGPGCSLVAYPFYVLDGEHCGCTEQLVIHNSFIQMLADLGALGFVPWMIFLGMSFIHTRQVQRRGLNAKYATALELALFGFVVCSLAGGFTYSWFPYILAALIVAMKRMSDAGSGHAAGQ